jgi:hypothetical protein
MVRKLMNKSNSAPAIARPMPLLDLNKEWYFLTPAEETRGPLSWSELRERMNERLVELDTLVWSEGMDDWQQLQSVPSLLNLFQQVSARRVPSPESLKREPKRANELGQLLFGDLDEAPMVPVFQNSFPLAIAAVPPPSSPPPPRPVENAQRPGVEVIEPRRRGLLGALKHMLNRETDQ